MLKARRSSLSAARLGSLVTRIVVIPWRQILFARSVIADVDSAD